MAEMYEIIDTLLKERGISGAQMSSDLGMSRSFMTELRKGRAKGIKLETAQKIAEYFGVSVDFLSGTEKNKALLSINEMEKQGSENRNLIRIAGRDGSYQVHYLSDGQLDAIKAIIAQLPDASDDL